MEALLFIAKYGVLLCGIIAVLCSASSQVRQLVLSFRHKNKFVQVLIFVWFVSLVVFRLFHSTTDVLLASTIESFSAAEN